MLRRIKLMVAPLLVLGLLVANLGIFSAQNTVSAHSWDGYHWNKGGTRVDLYHHWEFGSHYSEANAAMYNFWVSVGMLYNWWYSEHEDISVWDGNYGNTGWGGLAEIWLGWDWGCWCNRHITHGHARVNTYYGYNYTEIKGIFCQEIWHTYGFRHHPYSSCMGLGYYGGATYALSSHDVTDFYDKYWGH